MRIAYPIVTSMGFGNNVITLAKAYLIAQSCGMTYQRPVWPPTEHMPGSQNGYGYFFPTSIGDRFRLNLFSYLYRIQRKFSIRLWPPVVLFGRKEYEHTQVQDIGEACRVHLKRLGLEDQKKSVVVATNGMWGGYGAIKRARSWIREVLLSHSDTHQRYLDITNRIDKSLLIGVHLRLRDFLPPHAAQADRQGERLVCLPFDWVLRLSRQIRETCDCKFILATDGTPEEVRPFVQEFEPLSIISHPETALLGLLLLSRADLVICSNSTYSRIGCFLNDRPYIWFADTLVRDSSGDFGYLWKNNGTPQPAWLKPKVHSNKPSLDAVRRCFALSHNFSFLPKGLQRYLDSHGTIDVEIPDDLLYGEPVHLMS